LCDLRDEKTVTCGMKTARKKAIFTEYYDSYIVHSFPVTYLNEHVTSNTVQSCQPSKRSQKQTMLGYILYTVLYSYVTSEARLVAEPRMLNSFFFVNIESSKSSVFQLLYGVPQGSVLSTREQNREQHTSCLAQCWFIGHCRCVRSITTNCNAITLLISFNLTKQQFEQQLN